MSTGHENGGWMNDDQRSATRAAAREMRSPVGKEFARRNTVTTEPAPDVGNDRSAPESKEKPKKPAPTGAKLFSLVWQRCTRELRRLPSDAQRLQALEFARDELGLGKLPPGTPDARD